MNCTPFLSTKHLQKKAYALKKTLPSAKLKIENTTKRKKGSPICLQLKPILCVYLTKFFPQQIDVI